MTQADSTDLIWIREKEGKYFHLMAAKSIELVLQLILQQNWQKAENRKAHQKADAKTTELEIFFSTTHNF